MSGTSGSKMAVNTARGFLLILFLYQVDGQTTSKTTASSNPVSPASETTCGVGSSACPTDMMSESSTEFSNNVSTSTTHQQTTLVPVTPGGLSSTTTPENATENPAKVTSPKQEVTTTTTQSPPASKPITNTLPKEQSQAFSHSGTCACDLTACSCDVNCCCDPECTPLQRTSFSECKVDGYPLFDNRYCYATKLVFVNNSEHILQQAQNGAFCIVRSNLAGSVFYPSHPVYLTLQEFLKHWGQSHSQTWQESSIPKFFSFDKPQPYIAGVAIWVLQDGQIHSLDLPSSGLTSACSDVKSVSYLFPWSSQCIRKAPNSQVECEKISSYIHNQMQSIVRSPLLVNQTQLAQGKIKPCPSQICAPVKYMLCQISTGQEYDTSECKYVSNRRMVFGLKSGICYNVVKRLKLVFYHNGTEGIDFVEAYMWLLNMTMVEVPATRPLHQSFAVDFHWTTGNKTAHSASNKTAINSTVLMDETPFPRSGHPGYIVGKPIIAGFRVKHLSSVNISKDVSTPTKLDMIELSHEPKQWLTLPGSDIHGMCDWSKAKRHVVTFAEDVHMSCGLVISLRNTSSFSSCYSLRVKMLQLLLGDVSKSFQDSSAQTDWGRVLASYGSANVSVPQHWIPLLLDSQSPFTLLSQSAMSAGDVKTTVQEDADRPLQTCENIPLGIQIRIMYGFVGSITNPQSKIFGASLRFSPLQDVGRSCASETCFQTNELLRLRVVSTVKFVDVTSPAVTRFAEPPAIHIRLPPDFFYPFMSVEGSFGVSVYVIPLPLIISLLLMLFFLT